MFMFFPQDFHDGSRNGPSYQDTNGAVHCLLLHLLIPSKHRPASQSVIPNNHNGLYYFHPPPAFYGPNLSTPHGYLAIPPAHIQDLPPAYTPLTCTVYPKDYRGL